MRDGAGRGVRFAAPWRVVGLMACLFGMTLSLYAQAPGEGGTGLPPPAPGGPAPGAPGGPPAMGPGGGAPGGAPMMHQQGGPMGGGGPAEQPAIAVQGLYVYVVRGDILFQFTVEGLRLVKWAKLEVPSEATTPLPTKPTKMPRMPK